MKWPIPSPPKAEKTCPKSPDGKHDWMNWSGTGEVRITTDLWCSKCRRLKKGSK